MDLDQRTKDGITSLPASLEEAINEMKNSKLVRETLGEHVFSKYIEAKTKEWESYRMMVTKWEIDQYLKRY